MTSLAYSVAGWAFLPDFLTKQLLNFPPYRRALHRLSASHNHYRHTFALVVLSYLTYTLCNSIYTMESNFYQLLMVPPSVDESGLKSAFRRMTRTFHPDKLTAGHDEGEMFMQVRHMYEALKDPAKRFAYDRFGADVLSCQTCSTPREYLNHGLLQSAAYHVVSLAFLVFWSAMGSQNSISFWRYLLYTTLLLLEVSIILSPFPSSYSLPTLSLPPFPDPNTLTISSFIPSLSAHRILFPPISSPNPSMTSIPLTILTTVFPSRVPYQHVKLLHQLLIFFSIALSRVAPVLFPRSHTKEEAQIETGQLLLGLARSLELEARTSVQSLFNMIQPGLDEPHPDQETLSHLTASIEDVLVEEALSKEVPDAWNYLRENATKRTQSTSIPSPAKPVLLPSPRPSPPPLAGSPAFKRMESYGRARSISC